MDIGSRGSVEVGSADSEPDDAQDAQGATEITISINQGEVTIDGKEMSIGDALKAVLDAYEASEGEDHFAAGLADTGQREPKPTMTGMMRPA